MNDTNFTQFEQLEDETLAAGIIKPELATNSPEDLKSANINREDFDLKREEFESQKQQQGAVIWLTGLSASGKSTVAKALQKKLHSLERFVNSLDGDNVRHGLCSDLGFSESDRSENIRRIGQVARLFMENGNIVICSFISPMTKDREFVRSLMPQGRFVEAFIDTKLETCIERDNKGLYKKALSGEIKGFTGIDSPYEKPDGVELTIDTVNQTVDQCVDQILDYLNRNGIVGSR